MALRSRGAVAPAPPLVAYAASVCLLFATCGRIVLAEGSCTAPQIDMSKRPGECQVLSQVCVDHGSLLITHDDKYAVENLRREGTPSFPAMQWSLPLRGESGFSRPCHTLSCCAPALHRPPTSAAEANIATLDCNTSVYTCSQIFSPLTPTARSHTPPCPTPT